MSGFCIGTCVICKQPSDDLADVALWVKRPIYVLAEDHDTELAPIQEVHPACGKCREECELKVVGL